MKCSRCAKNFMNPVTYLRGEERPVMLCDRCEEVLLGETESTVTNWLDKSNFTTEIDAKTGEPKPLPGDTDG